VLENVALAIPEKDEPRSVLVEPRSVLVEPRSVLVEPRSVLVEPWVRAVIERGVDI